MKEIPELSDPSDKEVQFFLSDSIQQGDILQWALNFTGQADVTISTFSSSEEFLRKVLMLRKNGLIRRIVLYTDTKAAEKTARSNAMIKAAFDEIHLCKNHSKLMVVDGDNMSLSIVSSQNQTRGNRLESYVVLADAATRNYILDKLGNINTYELWTK